MSRLPGLYQWNAVVGKRFVHLSKPMAACLALWSLGMIVARSRSLTALAGLGPRWLARQPTGLGLGCDHPGTTLHRVGPQRPVSRLRRPGGLEGLEGHRSARLGTGMENAAEPFPSGRAGRLERDCADGSWAVRQVAL